MPARPEAAATRPGLPDRLSHRKGHPLALRLWLLLRDRSEADQRLVYEALLCRLDDEERTANQQIAMEALRRFAAARDEARAIPTPGTATADPSAASDDPEPPADQDQTPPPEPRPPRWADGPISKRRYSAFRQTRSDPRAWPSAAMVANAFGRQWARALEAAGLAPAADVLVRRRTARGRPFTREQVEGLVLEWVEHVDRLAAAHADGEAVARAEGGAHGPGADTGPETHDAEAPRIEPPLYFGHFVVWLEQQRLDPQAPERPLPSRPTARKLLGTWVEALQSLELLHRHPEAVRARASAEKKTPEWRRAEQAVAALDLGSAPRNPRRRHRQDSYSKTDLLNWIRWLTSTLPPERRPRVRISDWLLLRQAAILRAVERGTWLEIPSSKRILDEDGITSWPEAKVAAGIAEPEETGHQRVAEAYTRQELFDGVAAAAHAFGRLPARTEYIRWRSEELERRHATDPWARIPSEYILCLRLCRVGMSWEEVLEAVAKYEPALATLPRPKKHGNAGRRHHHRRHTERVH